MVRVAKLHLMLLDYLDVHFMVLVILYLITSCLPLWRCVKCGVKMARLWWFRGGHPPLGATHSSGLGVSGFNDQCKFSLPCLPWGIPLVIMLSLYGPMFAVITGWTLAQKYCLLPQDRQDMVVNIGVDIGVDIDASSQMPFLLSDHCEYSCLTYCLGTFLCIKFKSFMAEYHPLRQFVLGSQHWSETQGGKNVIRCGVCIALWRMNSEDDVLGLSFHRAVHSTTYSTTDYIFTTLSFTQMLTIQRKKEELQKQFIGAHFAEDLSSATSVRAHSIRNKKIKVLWETIY